VIRAIGVVSHAIGAVGWEWNRCWQWVGAAIGGTQVEPILVVGGVGAGGGVIGTARLLGAVGGGVVGA
jgi:hypothetical protein